MSTSGITFSGFNEIDFSVVLNAIMTQESQPLTALQKIQSDLQKTDANYATLATKLGALRSASSDLASPSSLFTYAATTSDSAALTTSASAGAIAGRYEVVVNELAHRQVMASASTAPDTDTTIIASGGTLTIGGETITVSSPVTLRQLVTQINADTNAPATAGIVETSPGAYRLTLSSKETGAANAFTVQNGLTGATLAFSDTDNDGTSGDSAADNAVTATDASVLVNNIPVTSTSNTLTAGIPGVSVTLLQKDPSKTVVVTVERDDSALAGRVDAFVSSYNDLVKFATDQSTAAGNGSKGTLGRDPLLRALRTQVRDALAAAHGSAAFTRLAEVGLGFNRTGQLTFDRAAFNTALEQDPTAVQTLFTHATTGVFTSVKSLVDNYTKAGGFVPAARTRVTDELSRLGRRMDDLTERLAVRRRSLQAQFTAADAAITRLKSQSGALSSFSTSLTSR